MIGALAGLFAISVSGPQILKRFAILFGARTGTRTANLVKPLQVMSGIALQFLLLATLAHGQAVSPDQQRQSLGSLNSVGEVFVNESRAPSEMTIFPGDTLRTGETGTAILTTSGNNSFQIPHLSQVVFTGDPHYFAELKLGAISVKSPGGTGGAVVRAGNFAVVPTNRNERTTATIDRMADGSFLVTCSAGNVGVIPLQETSGLFLQAGQSARISPKGELTALGTTTPAGTPSAGRSHRLWIYLGVAGGGIAAGTAAAIVLGENHALMSPVSP
jgi:hypothetical protein